MRVRVFAYDLYYQLISIVMRNVIYVVTHGIQWKVKCGHCGEEVKPTQAAAIKTAREHVASLPAGTLSQIVVQGANSQYRTEWTYGKDPFPPRG